MKTKDAYKAKFEAQLEQAQAKLLALKASAKEKMADGQLSINDQLNTLEQSVVELRVKLDELSDAGEDKLDEFKSRLEAAWGKVSAALNSSDAPNANSNKPKE